MSNPVLACVADLAFSFIHTHSLINTPEPCVGHRQYLMVVSAGFQKFLSFFANLFLFLHVADLFMYFLPCLGAPWWHFRRLCFPVI